MRNWRIPFAQPDIGSAEIASVEAVMRSGWITQGEKCEEFEHAFAEKFGIRNAIFVSSATAALHLSHAVLGISGGDEVICPALTFVASANAARYVGAIPRFAQVCSPEDPTIDPEDIEKLIGPRTRAIVVVHFAGFPARMAKILEVAEKHNLAIIEDCAHAPGAFCNIAGQKSFTGTIGRIGCFSFFSNKNLTTGEGGMLTTHDDSLAGELRQLRSHGMTTRTLERQASGAIGYDVSGLGYNYRSTEIAAAIGLCQLERLDGFNAARRRLFAEYLLLLESTKKVTVPFRERDLKQAVPHIMPVYFKSRRAMAKVKDALNAAGIQVSRHYDLIPYFTPFEGYRPAFRNKYKDLENTISLPLYPGLSLEAVEEICEIIQSVPLQ